MVVSEARRRLSFRVKLQKSYLLQHGLNSRFAGDLGVQKSVAKVDCFARSFATVGSDVMNIGYARVWTLDQNLDLQMPALGDLRSSGQGATKIAR